MHFNMNNVRIDASLVNLPFQQMTIWLRDIAHSMQCCRRAKLGEYLLGSLLMKEFDFNSLTNSKCKMNHPIGKYRTLVPAILCGRLILFKSGGLFSP